MITCAGRKSRSTLMSESTPSRSSTPDAVLRRLEWTVIRRLDGVLHGDYRTLFRGYGLDFADLRHPVHRKAHLSWPEAFKLDRP